MRCIFLMTALALLASCDSSGPPQIESAGTPAPQSGTAVLPTASPLPQQARDPEGRLPVFTAIGADAGIDFERFDDMRGRHRFMEANGGGVALFDFDRDGRLDVFFCNGCRWPLTAISETRTNEIFRGLGGTSYSRCTDKTGLVARCYFHGCAVGDFDADGFDDLYVTAFGPNVLFHNNGDGTFVEITEQTGTSVPVWSSSAAFADLNGDGWLDLYVVNYVKEDDPPRLCPHAAAPDGFIMCSPTDYPADDDVFFLNDGAGGFRDVTREAGLVDVDGKGLGVAVFDFNEDGRPDIFVANDGTPNFLYVNTTSRPEAAAPELLVPKFHERAAELGAALSYEGRAQSSMGIACGDYDSDGWLDLFVTNFHLETDALYHNLAGQGFTDEILASGLGPVSRQMLGFGTEFIDFDNDGRLDLFTANGHIDDLSWGPGHEPFRMKPQFFRNEGSGRFTDVSAWSGEYFQKEWLGRGVAMGDIDADGDLDIVVSHQLAPSAVLRNDTRSPNSSVILSLVGTGASNRSAIGARVEADGLSQKVVRQVIGGGSYQSASDRRVHIGLGGHPAIPRLQVRWPSGTVEEWTDVLPGGYIVIEGRGSLVGCR